MNGFDMPMEDSDAPTRPVEAQPALFDGESDDALFLERADLEKRYTAVQAMKIDSRRELICLAVASGWPVERIAVAGRCSTRTVRALAAREAEKVALGTADYVKILRQKCARWLVLAGTKDVDASFKDLIAAVSYLGNQANQMEAAGMGMGLGGGEEGAKGEPAIDIEASARRLLAMIEGTAPDVESGGTRAIAGGIGAVTGLDTGSDTSEAGRSGAEAGVDGAGRGVGEGEGGGSASGVAANLVMRAPERGFTGKESKV